MIIARRATLFLLLGAIVNVAVAWACVLSSEPTTGFELSQAQAERLISDREISARSGYHPAAEGLRGVGLSVTKLVLDAPYPEGTCLWSQITTAGLPLRSVEAEWQGLGQTFKEVFEGFQPIGGLHVPPSVRQPLALDWLLPYRPIWPGFAINTLFYATILWGLFAAPFALRRRRRIKRGLCPKCAYPIGTSDVCTECGKPLKATEMQKAGMT